MDRPSSGTALSSGIAAGWIVFAYKTAPGQGVWLNGDPLREGGGINLYGFAQNNPINYLDLWGLAPIAVTDSQSTAERYGVRLVSPAEVAGLVAGGQVTADYVASLSKDYNIFTVDDQVLNSVQSAQIILPATSISGLITGSNGDSRPRTTKIIKIL